jgi:hypothetical protein
MFVPFAQNSRRCCISVVQPFSPFRGTETDGIYSTATATKWKSESMSPDDVLRICTVNADAVTAVMIPTTFATPPDAVTSTAGVAANAAPNVIVYWPVLSFTDENLEPLAVPVLLTRPPNRVAYRYRSLSRTCVLCCAAVCVSPATHVLGAVQAIRFS